MNSSKKSAFGRYRDVSELRIQFQCEYKLYLGQKQGDQSSIASREGARLHERVVLDTASVRSLSPIARALIVIVTIAAAIFWILG